MEKYLDYSTGYLEEMLSACSDFKERQHIRGALRELKGLKLDGGAHITYSYDPDPIRRIQPRPEHDVANIKNARVKRGLSDTGQSVHKFVDRPPRWKPNSQPHENSPRHCDKETNYENRVPEIKSTSNLSEKFRSYLYAGNLGSPITETKDIKTRSRKDVVRDNSDKSEKTIKRSNSESLSNSPSRSNQVSSHERQNRRGGRRPVSLRLSDLKDSNNSESNTSPRSLPPPSPRKPRKISYRTSPFSSSSTSPFSPQTQTSPTSKVSLTAPKLEGIRSKSSQGNIAGNSQAISPRKCNRFFPNMKSDSVKTSCIENVSGMDDDSVFESKNHGIDIKRINVIDESVSDTQYINAIKSSLNERDNMSQSSSTVQDIISMEENGKENILSKSDRLDSDPSESRSTPRKKSTLSRKKRVNSESSKEVRLAYQKHKDEISDSVPNIDSGQLSVCVNPAEVSLDIDQEQTPCTPTSDRTKASHRKLPDLPPEDDETIHARTIRLLQERKKERQKKQEPSNETLEKTKSSVEKSKTVSEKSEIKLVKSIQVCDKSKPESEKQKSVPDKPKMTPDKSKMTPDKSKMSTAEMKKFLEEKLQRSDSKRKAARVRRELQLLDRENELKSPKPTKKLQKLCSFRVNSARDRENRVKLVQRSQSEIIQSKNELSEVQVDGVEDNMDFTSAVLQEIEATCRNQPLTPENKIEVIGSLMMEEARLQELLRKSSNFSEKRKMRAEIRKLREKRVELETFNDKPPSVIVKRCASVTAGMITPATLPDKCHIDMHSTQSIHELRKQLSETTDYDEKKKIRLALRQLRQQRDGGSVTGLQRSQSFVHQKSPQPVCNGDVQSGESHSVTRSRSVTDKRPHPAHTHTSVKHDSGLPNGKNSQCDNHTDKNVNTDNKVQFRRASASTAQTHDDSLSYKDRELLKSGRTSAPVLSKAVSSSKGGTFQEVNSPKGGSKVIKEEPESSIKKLVVEKLKQTPKNNTPIILTKSPNYIPPGLSRKHSLDSINNKQKSSQEGKNTLSEKCKIFENGVNEINNKQDQKTKPKSSSILISRADVTRNKSLDRNTPTTNVEKKPVEEILKPDNNKSLETTNKQRYLNSNCDDNNKDSDRKLSPSLLWLEDKRKSLPTIKDLDKLMSTMDIEAAFTEILDAVDTEQLNCESIDTPVIPVKSTADIPIMEEEISESSTNEELEALENRRNAEMYQMDNKMIEKMESEIIRNNVDSIDSGTVAVKECNNNNNIKSAITAPGNKHSEVKFELQSNLSLDLAPQPDPSSAISVIHGDDGTVTVQEVNKVQDGDTTITEWKKIRRTQSRTETRETDTVIEKSASSPGGSSSVYEKDISKTRKKITSRGSEYFSRNNYNITRVKDPEGAETVLHALSSESKNLSVTSNESWGDKSEATVVLHKDQDAITGTPETKLAAVTENNKVKQQKERKSVARSTSMCKIQLSNTKLRLDQDTEQKLEAQLGRPSGCPTITSPLSELSATEGSTAIMECVVKGAPPPTVIWYKGGNPLTLAPDTKFGYDSATGKSWMEICPVRTSHIGEYKCVFENEKGSASTMGKLQVKAEQISLPSFLTELQDTSVKEGQPLTIECTVEHTDTVAWYKDGVIQPNNPDFKQTFHGQTARMEISELFLDDSGVYTCKIRSEVGEQKSSCNIDVTESKSSHEVFPSFLKKPETQIVDEGDMVIIECDIIGSPNPDITWKLNGVCLEENDRNKFSYDGRVARLIIKKVTSADGGKVECLATNSCGQIAADCLLVVKEVKIEPKITKSLEDVTLTSGKAAVLECGIVGTSAEDISWRKNGCIIGQTFDFKQTYKDDIARLEIGNVCKADSGCYECTVNTENGSISSVCDLTIEDPQETKSAEPQLIVQEEKAQTATVKKFPTHFVPKVDEGQVKVAKSQASKIMLVRQGSWRIPGNEKAETPLKRAGSWQALSKKGESAKTPEKVEKEPILKTDLKTSNNDTKDNDEVQNNVKDVSNKVSSNKAIIKDETDKIKNKVEESKTKIQDNSQPDSFFNKKVEIIESKATIKLEKGKVPMCSVSKEESDIKPIMKFKAGGAIRRTQSVRTPGSEKPEWLQVKLKSVGSGKSPLSVQEKQAIEKSHGQSESTKIDNVEKTTSVNKEVKLSRSQSARVVDRTPVSPALRDSTNSPSNDPNNSVPKLTPVSERARMFQSKNISGKSSPTDIIAKAINLCRAESMRSPVGRSPVIMQRSQSFKTSQSGDVTLELTPQQSKAQQEKGDLGSSPKIIKYWDPIAHRTHTMADVASINDEETLNQMLSKTEDFEERKKIRGRMKEIREIHMKEWEEKRSARASTQEDEIKRKHREADAEKQRKLEAYQKQAAEHHEAKHLDMAEQHLRDRMKSADEAKKRQLDNFDKMARKEELSQTSTVTTDVSKDGKTTTTTRRVETVTKVGASKPAEEIAPAMVQQIINATSPLVSGGSLKVKTESWSSRDGVKTTSEKTESWGGRGRGGARNMFQQMDQKTNPGGAGRGGSAVVRSPSAIKTMLLEWCKAMTREYADKIVIENFSTSWNNGIAFCALIHHFYPNSFDFDSLDPKQRRKNFELAFDTAEKEADIAPLLDVEDMVRMKKPDWKCVFTYVQSFYRKLQNHERNRAIASES